MNKNYTKKNAKSLLILSRGAIVFAAISVFACGSAVIPEPPKMCEDDPSLCPEPKPEPRVFFRAPLDSEVTQIEVEMRFCAENFTIEPAGVAREGAGHFWVMIDVPCVTPGEKMPFAEGYNPYWYGEKKGWAYLPMGRHKLCLQVADGEGIALPYTETIEIYSADL